MDTVQPQHQEQVADAPVVERQPRWHAVIATDSGEPELVTAANKSQLAKKIGDDRMDDVIIAFNGRPLDMVKKTAVVFQ